MAKTHHSTLNQLVIGSNPIGVTGTSIVPRQNWIDDGSDSLSPDESLFNFPSKKHSISLEYRRDFRMVRLAMAFIIRARRAGLVVNLSGKNHAGGINP